MKDQNYASFKKYDLHCLVAFFQGIVLPPDLVMICQETQIGGFLHGVTLS